MQTQRQCQGQHHIVIFKKKVLEDTRPFCGTWIPLFWTSGDFWVSKPGWICHLRVSPPACNGFLRFTSGATPADLLAATMTAEPLSIHVLAHVHTIIGSVRVSNSIFGFHFSLRQAQKCFLSHWLRFTKQIYMINFNSNVDVNTTANVRCERTSRLLRFGERKTFTSELFCSTFQPIVQTDTNWSILPIKFQ